MLFSLRPSRKFMTSILQSIDPTKITLDGISLLFVEMPVELMDYDEMILPKSLWVVLLQQAAEHQQMLQWR